MRHGKMQHRRTGRYVGRGKRNAEACRAFKRHSAKRRRQAEREALAHGVEGNEDIPRVEQLASTWRAPWAD